MIDGMAGEQQSPPQPPRYGSYTREDREDREDREEIAVRVTSADFNGQSFDGSPFSVCPEWLQTAVKNGVIDISTKHGDRDYAVWAVTTKNGIVLAFPGDYIIRRKHGDLSVVPAEDAFILINLRPPVLSDNDEIS